MKKNKTYLVAISIFGAFTISGCAMVADKDLSGKLETQKAQDAGYGAPAQVFVEIPAGSEIGNSVVPNFKTSALKVTSALDVPMTGTVKAQADAADLNLPEVGTSSYFNSPVVFSMTKVALPTCSTMFNNQGNAVSKIIRATFPTVAYTAATFDAGLDSYINKLAERLWGRLSVNANERMALKTLKAEIAVTLKAQNMSDANISKGIGVGICTAMALAPDAVLQ